MLRAAICCFTSSGAVVDEALLVVSASCAEWVGCVDDVTGCAVEAKSDASSVADAVVDAGCACSAAETVAWVGASSGNSVNSQWRSLKNLRSTRSQEEKRETIIAKIYLFWCWE